MPSGAASRMTGFMAHLRHNGFAVGPGETELVLSTLAENEFPDVSTARLGLKTMLSGDRVQWSRFDELFDAYWFKRGLRLAERAPAKDSFRSHRQRPELWDKVLPPEEGSASSSRIERGPGEAEGPDGTSGSGRLIASTQDALMRTDLRTLVSPEDVAEAERIAERLACAMRYRLSRRRMPAGRGDTIDLRRTIRRNLSRGGEPIELRRKHRPERPVRLVVLLDVSGSMKVYSRYFLSFVRGLIGQWLQADAFLFHTRLVRVTDVLRERDASRAMGRLSLITEGFGGGTRIAASLKHFNGAEFPQRRDRDERRLRHRSNRSADRRAPASEGPRPPAGLAQPALGLEGLRAGGARYGRRARPYRLLRYCSFAGEPCRARKRVR